MTVDAAPVAGRLRAMSREIASCIGAFGSDDGAEDRAFREWSSELLEVAEWLEGRADRAAALARRFHTLYEALAPEYGHTGTGAPRAWEDVPERYRLLITGVCRQILAETHASLPAYYTKQP